MSRASLVLVFVAAVAMAAGDEPSNPESRIRKLRQERLVVLQELHDTVVSLNRLGVAEVGYEQVHESTMGLLHARLDLTQTKEERIKIHEQLVAEAASWVQVVMARIQAGAAGSTAIDLLKAKSLHLEVQVAWEQAKAAK